MRTDSCNFPVTQFSAGICSGDSSRVCDLLFGKTRQWMENCTVICLLCSRRLRLKHSCDAVSRVGREERCLSGKRRGSIFAPGRKPCGHAVLQHRPGRRHAKRRARTRMCKPTDCRRVPRPSKRGPFTIRSAYWLRFIRGLGARIPACRIICTMSR